MKYDRYVFSLRHVHSKATEYLGLRLRIEPSNTRLVDDSMTFDKFLSERRVKSFKHIQEEYVSSVKYSTRHNCAL